MKKKNRGNEFSSLFIAGWLVPMISELGGYIDVYSYDILAKATYFREQTSRAFHKYTLRYYKNTLELSIPSLLCFLTITFHLNKVYTQN